MITGCATHIQRFYKKLQDNLWQYKYNTWYFINWLEISMIIVILNLLFIIHITYCCDCDGPYNECMMCCDTAVIHVKICFYIYVYVNIFSLDSLKLEPAWESFCISILRGDKIIFIKWPHKLPCLGLCLGLCNVCLILVMFWWWLFIYIYICNVYLVSCLFVYI
jgi:hypothetical protein